jgi:arsenate reductase-like glutaredoxin family protein
MVQLMAKEPRLIRRPFMVADDKLLIGPEVRRA